MLINSLRYCFVNRHPLPKCAPLLTHAKPHTPAPVVAEVLCPSCPMVMKIPVCQVPQCACGKAPACRSIMARLRQVAGCYGQRFICGWRASTKIWCTRWSPGNGDPRASMSFPHCYTPCAKLAKGPASSEVIFQFACSRIDSVHLHEDLTPH